MQTNFSQPLRSSGKINAPQFFLVLFSLVGLGAVGTYGVKAIWRAHEDRVTRDLCREWAHTILADAKSSPPEVGVYEAVLPVNDMWEQSLTSVLIVEELANSVTVHSMGRDMIVSVDDCSYTGKDIHVRKSILKGIVAGSHSAGKGLTSGVIEGLSKAKDASLIKAKEGVRKVKTSLMSRFKRKEKSNGNG